MVAAQTPASPTGLPDRTAVPAGHASRRAAGGLLALLLVLGLGITSVALGAGSSARPDAASSGTVQDVQAGSALFLQSCAACHGPQGGGGPGGPAITNAGAALADFMLRTGRMPAAVANAPATVRGTPAFDDSQIRDLVAYVASLGQGPAIPNVVTDGADIAHGRDLFVSNCAACHGPTGGGGSVGGGFVAPPLDRADATTVGEAVLTGPGPMPAFTLSASDLNDLAAYVEYLHRAPNPGGAAPPAVGPVTEGFLAAIALFGLLLVARFVGIRGRARGESA